MSTEHYKLTDIQRYLDGELDKRAMHRLERISHHDPFLREALEGFERAGSVHHHHLDDLKGRLLKRVARRPRKFGAIWLIIPLATSLIFALSVGIYLLLRFAPVKHSPAAVKPHLQKSSPAR